MSQVHIITIYYANYITKERRISILETSNIYMSLSTIHITVRD